MKNYYIMIRGRVNEMDNIDFFLQQKYKEYSLSEEKQYDESFLYDNISQKQLQYLLSMMHSRINYLLQFMYIKKNSNSHYNADESRELLSIINLYEEMKEKLSTTEYSFELLKSYDEILSFCKTFLKQTGGSLIPENLPNIKMEKYKPIFQMEQMVDVENAHDKKKYALKLIGEGSYAQVFVYYDEFYNKNIVIKRAKEDLNQKELERFKNEYRVLEKLNSPYVINVYRYDDYNDEYYMEYAETTIEKFINHQNDTLSIEQRKNISFQIIKALEYVHSKGFLHRDLSYRNVLLVQYDDVVIVKLADFGLVKDEGSHLTSSESEVKGSLNDPALSLTGFGNYSIVHETYALTRLVYYIMTGKSTINKINDKRIELFLEKGLSSNNEDRYQSIDEFKKAFQKTW